MQIRVNCVEEEIASNVIVYDDQITSAAFT